MTIYLNVFNTIVCLSGDEKLFSTLFNSVKSNWFYYLADKPSKGVNLQINIESGHSLGVKITRHPYFAVKFVCLPDDENNASELQKLILAMLGEILELKGFVRLHAAVFCNQQSQNFLVEGPSGKGKSTTALNNFLNGGKIYTDEYTLWQKGKYFTLALPVSIQKDNSHCEWPKLIKANVKKSNPQKIDSLDFVTFQNGPIDIHEIKVYGRLFPKLGFAVRVFLGLGNVQMWRYRFQFSGLKSLFITAYFRLLAVNNILLNSNLKISNFKNYPAE